MENRYTVKYSLLCAFTVLIIIALLSFPASAAAVLDIRIAESINLTDEYDGVTLTQGMPTGEGEINITNLLGSTDLYDISLNFSEGSSSSWDTSASGVTLDTGGDGYVTVHINALGHGESAIINYVCPGLRPVSFQESYESEKMILGGATNVSLTLVNNTAGSTITNIQLVKTAADSDNDLAPDFQFSAEEVDAGEVTNDGSTITWTVPELNSSVSEVTLNFTATDSDQDAHNISGIQSSMKHYLGNATLQFSIDDGTVSGSGVELNEDPTAVTSSFEINLQKNQLGPEDGNPVENGTDDWGFTPWIRNTDTETIRFSISSVTLYVTNSTVLEKNSAFATKSCGTGIILNSGVWSGSEWKVYDFPDPVPVGWIDVDLSLDFSDSEGQLSDSYSTTGGTYRLIETVYIINGYLVEAKKTIVKNATYENQYDITLWVHNKGSLATPPTVVVYDIVPTNFTPRYWGTDPDGSTGVVSPITGTAYWWDVGTLQPDTQDGDEVYIHYTVEGDGLTYSLTDLFILGIDPSYSLNMQSTPVLKTGARVVSGSGVKTVMSILTMSSLLLGMVGLRKKKREN